MTKRPNGDTDATKREARGSVQEAIGKLIGDDIVRDQGKAEQAAAGGAAVAQDHARKFPQD